MQDTFKSKAIVLSRQDYRENDVLVFFYSREKGELSLVARGAKKINSKLAGHIEPLNLVDLMRIRGKGRDYVGSAKSLRCFGGIKKDFQKTNAALKISGDLKKNLKEGEADEDLFDFFVYTLEYLEGSSRVDSDFFYSVFILKFLDFLGYSLSLNNCSDCFKKISPKSNFISAKKGGILCPDCGSKNSDNLTISDDSIKILRIANKESFDEIFKISLSTKRRNEFINIIRSFKEYHLN